MKEQGENLANLSTERLPENLFSFIVNKGINLLGQSARTKSCSNAGLFFKIKR